MQRVNSVVIPLRDVRDSQASLIGGKAIGLSELATFGFDVPDGFVVTTSAYRQFVEPIAGDLQTILAEAVGPDDYPRVSESVAALFAAQPISSHVRDEVAAAYAALGAGAEPVAVRSSATDEDAADASHAGQQDTYLWISGTDNVCAAIAKCWASLFTSRAIGYRSARGIAVDGLGMGVVVQRMVDALSAGVMMTINPTTGNQDEIYIESSYGLGESVVSGVVSPDRIHVDKCSGRIRAFQLGRKCTALRRTEIGIAVEEVPPDEQLEPSLTHAEAGELAEIGMRIERAFGRPMDIEWALELSTRKDGGAPAGKRRLRLLQARPETVWSQRSAPVDVADPLMSTSNDHTYWTRSNVGEAVPGVMTPLNWSVWRGVAEGAIRRTALAAGALSPAEARVPALDAQRYLHSFYGKLAVNTEYLAMLGDRLPGTSGHEIIASVLGRVPDGMTFHPTRRRYPIVLWRLTNTFVRFPSQARRLQAEFDQWWPDAVSRVGDADLAAAAALFKNALSMFDRALTLQSIANLVVVAPLYGALEKLVAGAGVGSVADLSGPGHAETALVSDIWAVSRDTMTVSDFLLRHGFHGPDEGELSSRVWREDPTPVRALVEQYRGRADADDPNVAERVRERRRHKVVQEMIGALPPHRRPAAKAMVALGRRRIPMRGIVKQNFLQALDVCRASARRMGELMVAEGLIAENDDVFFLDIDDLERPRAAGLSAKIEVRKRYWVQHNQVEVPGDWRGVPTVVLKADMLDNNQSGPQSMTGVGVCSGIAEGTARVLHSPDFTLVRPGEILVAPSTDPSWSSAMFISSGLVVDIGGALSHAAVVARELEIPCVVNTRVGTRTIRTGDTVRVDGGTGQVDILARASDESEQ